MEEIRRRRISFLNLMLFADFLHELLDWALEDKAYKQGLGMALETRRIDKALLKGWVFWFDIGEHSLFAEGGTQQICRGKIG